MCGCILEDNYDEGVCDCCLDDIYESEWITEVDS